ncbi:MAG: alkaline phosphatase [Bacteroidetes bacterium]|nr:alkaline phosphatase [Bacteroidota bacterium]MCP4123777.1 alkaline phosphatase [Bacteroidota bacterium]
MKSYVLAFIFCFSVFNLFSQEDYKKESDDAKLVYKGSKPYHVKKFKSKKKKKKPKNIILFIGDGMGTAQVFAGLTANHGHLFLENFKYAGFSKTKSSNKYTTDSAAGGTALSAGIKTYNGAIGVNPDTVSVKTILEEAEDNGLSTGLVSTSAITHATPASFIAHQKKRSMYEEIAADFLNTDVDVIIGGGYAHFAERKDGRDLTKELAAKDYKVLRSMSELKGISAGKVAAFTAPTHNGRIAERGDFLPVATQKAIELLKNDRDGFFLMVEGSQIDWGAHQNNTTYVVEEMLDFDKAIGEALEFAANDGKTLIIVTADHETGGMTLLEGDIKTGMVKGGYTTGGHTSIMVPVFAFGPGAENFGGIYENTAIYKKMKTLFRFK